MFSSKHLHVACITQPLLIYQRYELTKTSEYSVCQHWNQVTTADPVTRIAIQVYPDVIWIGKMWNTLRNCANNALHVLSIVYSL